MRLYILRTNHTENMSSIVNDACLLLGYLAVDVLLMPASVLRGCIYSPLAYQWVSTFSLLFRLFKQCLPNRCLGTAHIS